MNQGTTTTLIRDLSKEDVLANKSIAILIDRAKNFEYHDFKSEIPAPKIMLFRDLKLIGLDELAEKAINGEYDELD